MAAFASSRGNNSLSIYSFLATKNLLDILNGFNCGFRLQMCINMNGTNIDQLVDAELT